MGIKIGDKLPTATFMHMGENGPEPITSEDLFAGQKVAVFALPGAFTPTCSAKHLPGYMEQAEALAGKGINKIAQKVGEEAVEVVIEAKDNDDNLFLNESADLLFHYLILLQAKGCTLNDVINILKTRHN